MNLRCLSILRSKITIYNHTQLYGYFTYYEIVQLVDRFDVIEEKGSSYYNYSLKQIKNGINGCTYFYFKFRKMKSFDQKYVNYLIDKIIK